MRYCSDWLVAEAALFDEKATLNGIEMEATLSDIFENADRRAGLVGDGLPADS